MELDRCARFNQRRRNKVNMNENAKIRLIEKILRFSGSDDNCDENNDSASRTIKNLQNADIVRIVDSMIRSNYSNSYITSVLSTILRNAIAVTREAVGETFAKMDALRNNNGPKRSIKTDGILTFTESEYFTMLERVCAFIDDEATITTTTENIRNDRLFLYVFYMLSVTGKRLSDVANLSSCGLRQLRERGVCVIRIRKTDKLGRLEIPEILGRIDKDIVDDDDEASFRPDTYSGIIRRLRIFEQWVSDRNLNIPFDRERARRYLDKKLAILYTTSFDRVKPKGLSFHALRRIYAGYKFLHGRSVARLQENLDHSSRAQTNRYINSCLYELMNRT